MAALLSGLLKLQSEYRHLCWMQLLAGVVKFPKGAADVK